MPKLCPISYLDGFFRKRRTNYHYLLWNKILNETFIGIYSTVSVNIQFLSLDLIDGIEVDKMIVNNIVLTPRFCKFTAVTLSTLMSIVT